MEFYVEEDISAAEALQLIKTEPPKANNDLKNGEDYQLYENDRQSTDPFSSYFYSHQGPYSSLGLNSSLKLTKISYKFSHVS